MRYSRLRPIAIALALVLVLVAAPFGAATALAQDNTTDTRTADLVIEQPDYVDGDVNRVTDNGTRVYTAEGERLLLTPTNVDRDQIIDYGMDTDAGSFSKDSDLGLWTLDPEGEKGTFDLYWVVNEQRTDGNATTTEQVRYEASVRVDGSAGGTYLTADEHTTLQERADLGDKVESIVSDLQGRWLPFFDASGDPADVLESMGTLAATVGNPLNIFSEGYIGFHTFVVISIGGMLAALQYLGAFAWVVRKLRREKHEFEVTESHEGEIAERQLEVDEQERLQRLANMDWFDIFEDDHIARAFRDHLGETVLDGWVRLNSLILPRNLVRDRVKAMGQAGYVAVATLDRPPIDGDDEDDETPEPTVEAVDLVRERDLDRDALGKTEVVVALPDPGTDAVCDLETIVDELDWGGDELASFDFDDAALNAAQLDTTIETLDLERLVEQLNVQMDHFDDEEQYGEYLHEFLTHVREHPFTDDDGTPDSMRYVFNNWLQAAQLLEDRYGFPLAEYQVNAFGAAVDNYDRSARAAAYSEEVQTGAV